MGGGESETRCSQTWRMPAAVRKSVINTMAMVISQKAHISTTCDLLLLAALPLRIGIAYEIIIITSMA